MGRLSFEKMVVWEEGTLWVIARNGSVGWLKWMWFYNEIIRREEKNNGIDWIDLLSICSKQKKIDCNIPVRLKLVERNLLIINRSDSFISKINNRQKRCETSFSIYHFGPQYQPKENLWSDSTLCGENHSRLVHLIYFAQLDSLASTRQCLNLRLHTVDNPCETCWPEFCDHVAVNNLKQMCSRENTRSN